MAENGISTYIKYLFGFSILRNFFPKLGVFCFVFYVGYICWCALGPEKPEPDMKRKAIAGKAVKKIVEDIRQNRGDIRSVTMIHFGNDPTDYISDSLRNELNVSGVLTLEQVEFGERVRKKLKLPILGVSNVKDALKRAEHSSSQGILWGRVDVFESSDSGSVLKGEWYIVDRVSGEKICSGVISEGAVSPAQQEINKAVNNIADTLKKETAVVESTARLLPWHIRFFGFVLVVMLLPIITITFIQSMVAKKSNKVNAFILGTYTVIDAIFAFFMIGGNFSSFFQVLFFLIVVTAALFYNAGLMNFALKLKE